MSTKKIKRMAGLTVLNLIFIIICLLALIPILYAVSLSFCNGGSGLSSDLSFWPKDPTWKNYSAILVEERRSRRLMHFQDTVLKEGTGCSRRFLF